MAAKVFTLSHRSDLVNLLRVQQNGMSSLLLKLFREVPSLLPAPLYFFLAWGLPFPRLPLFIAILCILTEHIFIVNNGTAIHSLLIGFVLLQPEYIL